MDTTIEPTTDERPRLGRPRKNISAKVADLHALGMKRAEIAAHLGMSDGHNGSLARALQRADCHDLLAAITPPNWTHERREAGRTAWRERCAA